MQTAYRVRERSLSWEALCFGTVTCLEAGINRAEVRTCECPLRIAMKKNSRMSFDVLIHKAEHVLYTL